MKVLLLACSAAFLFSCNSSDKSKKQETTIQNSDSVLHDHDTKSDPVSVDIIPAPITAKELPATIKFKGKLQEAWQWKDKLGDNIFFTSRVAPFDHKDEYGDEVKTAEIHALHYVKKDGEYALLWKTNDAEKDCGFDLTCEFIKGGTTITDLDKDGVAETTIQYRMACRSDVSPAFMKLVMHEDHTQYSLQGLSWLKSSEEDRFTVTENDVNLEKLPGYKKTDEEYMKTFGRYQSEKEFDGAPPEFLSYARQQWMKFVKENID